MEGVMTAEDAQAVITPDDSISGDEFSRRLSQHDREMHMIGEIVSSIREDWGQQSDTGTVPH